MPGSLDNIYSLDANQNALNAWSLDSLNPIPTDQLTQDCVKFMTEFEALMGAKLAFQIKSFPNKMNSFITNFGFMPNELGKYTNCMEDPDMKYYYGFYYFAPTPQHTVYNDFARAGVCVPTECNTSDVNVIFNFTKVAASMMAITYKYVDIEVIQKKVNSTRPVGFYVFFAIFGFFSVLTIVLTICSRCKKMKAKKENINLSLDETKRHSKLDLPPTPKLDLSNDLSEKNIKTPKQPFKDTDTFINIDKSNDYMSGKSKVKPSIATTTYENVTTIKESKIILRNTGTQGSFKNSNLSTPAQEPKVTEKKQPSTCDRILSAFDFVERWQKISKGQRPTAESGAFDLVRVLSMTWVVMCHQFSQRAQYSSGLINQPYEMDFVSKD